MAVSYNKLWHITLDRKMKKKDLAQIAGLTDYAIRSLSNNKSVTTEVIAKLCNALSCTPDEIMEILPDEKQPSQGGQGHVCFK